MLSSSSRSATEGHGRFSFKELLFEGCIVAVAGAVLAFAANALSPRGLVLTKDYFRIAERTPAAPAPPVTDPSPGQAPASGNPRPVALNPTNQAPLAATNPAPQAAGPGVPGSTNPPAGSAPATNSAWAMLEARLRAEGLQLADSNQVIQLFHDPRCGQDSIIFIDARNEDHYAEGHIPGAYLLDYFHPEKYLAAVWQASQTAERVVVYCNGGDCQDSELAALLLKDSNVPKEKLRVYGGGLAEWATNGLPIELGERRSGRLRLTSK